MLPMPDAGDTWAEGPIVERLSTRVPGLGNAEGSIDLDSEWMARAAERESRTSPLAVTPKSAKPLSPE